MKILVIGSGGREHALVWKLSQSKKVKKIYCAPGNAGIAALAEDVPISAENNNDLVAFAKKKGIGLTVVGPELPLSRGLVDDFEGAGLRIFGPRKNAALIEASKCFTKELCSRTDIPTAPYEIFTTASEAKKAVKKNKRYPIVIKADGLAQGKGVVIAKSEDHALESIEDMMVHEKFGEAGRRIVIEEFMEGEEATFMVATDGCDFVPLASAQDHKRLLDGDEGPNTGGMGATSPALIVTPDVSNQIVRRILRPFLSGMAKEGRLYRGILYAGLMIHRGEPRLVEFNCRFGDPEAQAILFRMKSDLVSLIEAVLNGKVASHSVEFFPQPSVCVVMAAGGYPGSYEKGRPIKGLEKAAAMKDVCVFHAGTRREGARFVTNGGRVLGVTARGKNLKGALTSAYKAVGKISWEGAVYRTDIGKKGLMGV